MQLLKITSSPIQYQYQVESARLENQKPTLPEYDIQRQPSKLSVKTQDVQVQISNRRAYQSMGFHGTVAWAKEYGSRGLKAADRAKGEAAQTGNQMARIQDGVTIAQIVQNRLMQGPPMAVHTFLPSAGPDISWQPHQVSTTYQPDRVRFDWQTQREPMEYVPGKFSLLITQYPELNIEYLGGFNYVPPSADPEYEESPGQ